MFMLKHNVNAEQFGQNNALLLAIWLQLQVNYLGAAIANGQLPSGHAS